MQDLARLIVRRIFENSGPVVHLRAIKRVAEPILELLYPDNRNIPQKCRQKVCELRDEEFIDFVDGKGTYSRRTW